MALVPFAFFTSQFLCPPFPPLFLLVHLRLFSAQERISELNSNFEKFRRTENLDQADCLSPLIDNQSAKKEESVVASVSFERDVQHILTESNQNNPVSVEDIRKEAEKDAVPQQAAKNSIRQDPALCPQSETPWTGLHVDFVGPVSSITYLVVVDSYSKWTEVVPLTVATSGTTIGVLDRIFSTHGLPKTLISDNGTQFTSVDFKEFCEQRSIEHIRISPYHPQLNGQAERFVDTLKRCLQKAKGERTMDEVLQNFLLGYRSTPHPAIGEKSPAKVLMGRKLRRVHEAMLPKKAQPNEKTGNKKNGFAVNAPVYASYYRLGRQGTAAIIKERHGSMIYDVEVGKDIVSHHFHLEDNEDRTVEVKNGSDYEAGKLQRQGSTRSSDHGHHFATFSCLRRESIHLQNRKRRKETITFYNIKFE
ncbi:unnamed protein product [Hymenolepis diminuta]|uniref:Integrase catalytic domain-containing protein n=1 Tax=Hymenolepis diminuta TaxID=6216 RepID=A0A564XWK5_HYMDI|nr:unnamed protein product [Hymenolepis diminuta]